MGRFIACETITFDLPLIFELDLPVEKGETRVEVGSGNLLTCFDGLERK